MKWKKREKINSFSITNNRHSILPRFSSPSHALLWNKLVLCSFVLQRTFCYGTFIINFYCIIKVDCRCLFCCCCEFGFFFRSIQSLGIFNIQYRFVYDKRLCFFYFFCFVAVFVIIVVDVLCVFDKVSRRHFSSFIFIFAICTLQCEYILQVLTKIS